MLYICVYISAPKVINLLLQKKVSMRRAVGLAVKAEAERMQASFHNQKVEIRTVDLKKKIACRT